MLSENDCSCSTRSAHRGSVTATIVAFAFLFLSAPLSRAQVEVFNGAGLGAYSGQVIPTGRAVQLVSQPQVFSASEQPSGIVVANPYAALLAATTQQAQQAQQDTYGDSRSFAEAQAANLLNQQPDVQPQTESPYQAEPRIQVIQQERPTMAVRLIAQPQFEATPDQAMSQLSSQDAPDAQSVLQGEQASEELASKLLAGISNITSALSQRYSAAAADKANATAALGRTAGKSQPGTAVADLPDAIAEERKAIAQVTQPSNLFQRAAGDDSALSSQQPSVTVVKVQESSSEPGVRHVEVLTLQKKPKAAATAAARPMAHRPEDARFESAAAPAGAVHAAPAPVMAPSAQPSADLPASIKVFQKKAGGSKSFEQRAVATLRRIAAAPASDVEVISAPGLAPSSAAAAAPLASNDLRTLVAKHNGKKKETAPAAAPAADAVHTIQVNRKYGGDSLGAQIAAAAAAPAQPREENAHMHSGEMVSQQLAEATHPAVIWQSHLLDITPAQWPSYKDSYVSGIAQGANVAQSQVTIVGVTSASTVTINTQITYPNDDTAAAKELAGSLKDAQGAPIYIPNFGQVQVSGVTQLDAPAVPQFTGSSQVSWTGTSAAALGPAAPTAYAPALQPGASMNTAGTTQQSLSTLQQPQLPTAGAVPQVKRQDQVYNNNGLPLWAAIGIPVGVIVVVALLLLAAKHQRARTERLTKSLLLDSANDAGLKSRTETEESEA